MHAQVKYNFKLLSCCVFVLFLLDNDKIESNVICVFQQVISEVEKQEVIETSSSSVVSPEPPMNEDSVEKTVVEEKEETTTEQVAYFNPHAYPNTKHRNNHVTFIYWIERMYRRCLTFHLEKTMT